MPRKKQFTVPDVLARAVRTFSEHGYHATSVENLVQEMRVNRGSIYDTFESKRELFLCALRYHLETEGDLLQEIVGQAPSPLVAIMALAERVAGDRFIIRAAVELAPHEDEIGQTVAEAQRAVARRFGALIEQGQGGGVIDGAVDPVQAGGALLGLCIGAGVVGAPPAALQQQVRALLPAPSGLRA